MTRDEILQVLKDARIEWRTDSSAGGWLSLHNKQADALLAAQSDEATIADLKARGVLAQVHPNYTVKSGEGPAALFRVVLPGPAMEDEQ